MSFSGGEIIENVSFLFCVAAIWHCPMALPYVFALPYDGFAIWPLPYGSAIWLCHLCQIAGLRKRAGGLDFHLFSQQSVGYANEKLVLMFDFSVESELHKRT